MPTDEMPLTDKFGRAITDLRISITDRCNYKCVYCRTGNEGAIYGELPFADYSRMARVDGLAGDHEGSHHGRRAASAQGSRGLCARVGATCQTSSGNEPRHCHHDQRSLAGRDGEAAQRCRAEPRSPSAWTRSIPTHSQESHASRAASIKCSPVSVLRAKQASALSK